MTLIRVIDVQFEYLNSFTESLPYYIIQFTVLWATEDISITPRMIMDHGSAYSWFCDSRAFLLPVQGFLMQSKACYRGLKLESYLTNSASEGDGPEIILYIALVEMKSPVCFNFIFFFIISL